MLKNGLLSVFLFSFISLPAMADPEHARQLGAQARAMLEKIETARANADQAAILAAPNFSSHLKRDLQAFGLGAARLSTEIKDLGGPKDFQCIFRGMAEETGVQLKAIATAHTGYEQSDALTRLHSMLEDADAVSEAARLTMLKKQSSNLTHATSDIIGSCQRAER